MKISCPGCAKSLSVKDELAGRRVKCPGCQQAFQIPASTAIAAAKVGRPAAPPPPPVPEAKPPKRKKSTPCPECGAPLAMGATDCTECDWSAEEPRRKPSRRAARDEDEEGGLYLFIRRDDVDLNQAIAQRLQKLCKSELLDLRLMDEDDDPPDELGPNDLVISGKVTNCDHGSQLMRYFLTFVTLFGPWSCRLEVEATAETDAGKRKIQAKSRQWAGLFGGSGTRLMKTNVKAVSRKIATEAIRSYTGLWFLNVHAYHCGFWSLGLGLIGLVPFLGIPFALVALGLGSIALVTIHKRKLPSYKWVALAGIVLSVLGLLGTVAVLALGLKR